MRTAEVLITYAIKVTYICSSVTLYCIYISNVINLQLKMPIGTIYSFTVKLWEKVMVWLIGCAYVASI